MAENDTRAGARAGIKSWREPFFYARAPAGPVAMPMDMSDSGGERTDDPGSYRRTCEEFVRSMVPDYKAWVEYYKLPGPEDERRRSGIDDAAERCVEWLHGAARTIRAIDLVMNDGIQKMAEATAGRPFQLGVFVNSRAGYAIAQPGIVPVRVRAAGRDGRTTRLGFHYGDARFRIDSTFGASIQEPAAAESGSLDAQIMLDARPASPGDLVSFTVTVVEADGERETDRRGVTTLVRIA